MDILKGHAVGDVHIVIYETNDGEKIFHVTTNNDSVSPIADIIEDTLTKY